MKYFVVFALCLGAASAFVLPPIVAGANAEQIQEIIDAIYHPSTDPATAAALEQMLLDILGVSVVDVGPAIIDDSVISEPANVPEEAPIQTIPAFVDPPKSPLVQIIVNVNPNVPGNPVVVEQPELKPEIKPTPVIVVEKPEIPPENVIVSPIIVPDPVIVAPIDPVIVAPIDPVIVAPIEPVPVVNLPGTLN